MSTGPRRLGRYELQARLAQGGMGEVWKAFDTQLRRIVAIKLLRTDLQQDPEFVERFEREAQLIATLRHPNIVQLHDFDIAQESDQATAYMVMDYVKGQTLADYIRSTARKGNFPPAEDLTYIFAMTSLAIDYAHNEMQMIHRDIKPANILLDQRLPSARSMGEPVLTDFGIARLQGVATGTVVGSLLGTPLYISPEQARGLHGDKRSDLYSLGVILYEMTTGVTPFRGETTMAILMQHLHEMPTPPALINSDIPAALSEVILKSIAKLPADRYNSAQEMTVAMARAIHAPLPERFLQHLRSSESSYQSGNTLAPTQLAPSPNQVPQRPMERFQTPTYGLAPSQNGPGVTPAYGNPGQALPATPTGAYTPHPIESARILNPDSARKKQGRSWRIPALILLIALLLGGGVGAVALLTHSPGQQTLTPGAQATGTLKIGSKPGTQQANQLTLDIDGVSPPQNGSVYYAWVQAGGEDISPMRWPLAVKNNAIHTTLDAPELAEMLTKKPLFLITAESTSNPITPAIPIEARRFYTRLNTNTATFTIAPCNPNQPDSCR